MLMTTNYPILNSSCHSNPHIETCTYNTPRNQTIPHDGVIRMLFLFNQERLVVFDHKGIADILVTNAYSWKKPGSASRALASITGKGLIAIEGDPHRVQRRKLMPAFSFRHVKDLYPVFWTKTCESVQAMTSAVQAGRPELAVSEWASRATLDIIGMAAMGRDFGAVRNPDSELVRKYTRVFESQDLMPLFALLGLVLPQWLIECIPTKRIREFKESATVIRKLCGELVREKRTKLEAEKREGKVAEHEVNILSVALESGHFSDQSLEDHLMTFFAAGHETTSVSLTWAMYALCRNPEMQKRLRDEVRANLPRLDNADAAAAITCTDIDRLPYLNAVVNETLRLYPAVPISAREAVEDTTVMGYPITRGQAITLPPWAVNVDKTFWGDDADKFVPDRWIDHQADGTETPNNKGGASSNYAFMTFLHGPRSCIGSGFARAEFACLLAGWIGRFEFELAEKELMDDSKLKISRGVTIKPEGFKVIAKVVPGF